MTKVVCLLFSLIVFSSQARTLATEAECTFGSYQYMMNPYDRTVACLPIGQMPYSPNSNCVRCRPWMMNEYMNGYTPNWGFNPFFSSMPQPWWATQGGMYYPNMYYPGAWSGRGLSSPSYPGTEHVGMAKPNIYVKSQQKVSLQLSFINSKAEFLATTPYLKNGNLWDVVAEKDRFIVDNITYDYLFYDARASLQDFQFKGGVCTTRDQLLLLMEDDLRYLEHSENSIRDFKEHWSVKIPSYPYYCVYPQYTQHLDRAVPLTVSLKSYFSRTLYIVVPYEDLSFKDQTKIFPPLPVSDFTKLRPKLSDNESLQLREWGVAFLFDEAFQ